MEVAMKIFSRFLLIGIILLVSCTAAISTNEVRGIDVVSSEAFNAYIVLGRPTESSITLRITPKNSCQVKVIYRVSDTSQLFESSLHAASKDSPGNIELINLSKDMSYDYQVMLMFDDYQEVSKFNSFSTARSEGESFKFVIQSDSHFNTKADKEVYLDGLNSMKAFEPDFLVDLGDTFINDYFPESTYDEVNNRYYEHLEYFDVLTRSVPLFLVIGNHEGEYGYLMDDSAENLPIYATKSRKQYFPNPIPNDFYSGNPEIEPYVGMPENYYAYTWGDALFVMIDPYRYTDEKPEGNDWLWTLGDAQYNWLEETLSESNSTYKFIFSHHMIGNFRGSNEIVNLYEWGGQDKKGRDRFSANRPNMTMPVHDLLVENNVTIFFQGHDHIYARETVDGVIYQTLPKPAETLPDRETNQSFYGENIQMNSGYLEVTVENSYVQVDYRRMVMPVEGFDSTGIVNSYQISKDGIIKELFSTDDSLAFEKYGGNSNRRIGRPQKGKPNDTNKSNNTN